MKHILKTLTFLVVINLTCTSIGGETMMRNDQVANQLIKLSPDNGPGIQYIIVNKDAVIYSHSSGFADIKNKIPLSLNHKLSAFSMSKVFTAIAVLQLAERKKIDIDDKVSEFIEHPYNQEISIRHLLNHTSGVPNPIPLKWVHTTEEHNSFIESEALSKVLTENPRSDSSPGEKYSYSNIGYWLLGNVIENVTKQNYSDYVRENIFLPLRLKPDDIEFEITGSSRHVKGYLAKYSLINIVKSFVTDKAVWGKYEGNWLHIKDVYVNGPSFGGAIGSAKAFSRILQDLLCDRSVLLNENSRRLLYSQQKTVSGNLLDMALGWHIGILGKAQYFYKEGGGAGFHCEMRIYPAMGLASVIMTNNTSFNSRKKLSNIDNMFIAE